VVERVLRRLRRWHGPLLDQGRLGPTGPTRGTARVFIDGAYVKTVDLRRSSFSAHVAVYSRTWTTAGRHTIRIEVVGTSTHPMVAIDEFVVKS
jgi:hypothetical protein